MLIAITAVVAVIAAVGAVFTVMQLTGDGGSEPAAIDEDYLGAWQGETGSRGSDDWRAVRFEIDETEGETVGTARVLSMDVLCVFDITMESFDDRLEFTERTRSSVPESASQDTCRDNQTVQTLRLKGNGTMAWTNEGQSADLERSDATGREVVPEDMLGDWSDDWTTQDDGTAVSDDITISQGAVGDAVMRYTQQYGDLTCVQENELVQVDGARILVGPDELVAEESDSGCTTNESLWLHVDESGDLRLVWTDDPETDEYPVCRTDC
jgi:hypothetical protein